MTYRIFFFITLAEMGFHTFLIVVEVQKRKKAHFPFNTFVVFCIKRHEKREQKHRVLIFSLNSQHLCVLEFRPQPVTATADFMTAHVYLTSYLEHFTVKCLALPTFARSPCIRHSLHVSEWRVVVRRTCQRSTWMSFGQGRRDKCRGQRLSRARQLQGRRSSRAEYIYRAAFLGIRLLSNWAPVAPRNPHPPVVGDLCGEAAALISIYWMSPTGLACLCPHEDIYTVWKSYHISI